MRGLPTRKYIPGVALYLVSSVLYYSVDKHQQEYLKSSRESCMTRPPGKSVQARGQLHGQIVWYDLWHMYTDDATPNSSTLQALDAICTRWASLMLFEPCFRASGHHVAHWLQRLVAADCPPVLQAISCVII